MYLLRSYCSCVEPSGMIDNDTDTHLSELKVGQAVLARELGEDTGEVDAGGGPGGVEGDHPHHVLVSGDFFSEVVLAEVDNVLWALVGRLRQKKTLKGKKIRCLFQHLRWYLVKPMK